MALAFRNLLAFVYFGDFVFEELVAFVAKLNDIGAISAPS
jgi:hypothetical protein